MCNAKIVRKVHHLAQHYSVLEEKYRFLIQWWDVCIRLNYNWCNTHNTQT